MSPSEQIDEYARGWGELLKLVRNGHSWSGGERNRMFLNGQVGGFHEVSHLAGLDQADDGRGIAVVDWDQDGRLDLWYRNRTAPRLRLMMNRREAGESIAIKLEGVSVNREGIGAVVELLPARENRRSVRSVRAGDLFLSQSSKWLHFGLDEGGTYTQAMVIWPGGEKEVFEGIAAGGRFVLRQGVKQAEVQKSRSGVVNLEASEMNASKDDGIARIVLPSRIPIPVIGFRDQLARPSRLQANGKAKLLVLWSGDCAHCKRELNAISKESATIRGENLEVLALSVEGIEGAAADTSSAYDLIDSSGFPFPWGLIDRDSVGRLHGWQEALFDRTPASSVPLTILLDGLNQAVAIYRGPLEIADVVSDWRMLRDADEHRLYHLAPPMKGTWFTNPLPQREVVRLLRRK